MGIKAKEENTMKLLIKTTDKEKALEIEKEAQKIYGGAAVYRFQYQSNDGKFYYEILLNEIWI